MVDQEPSRSRRAAGGGTSGHPAGEPNAELTTDVLDDWTHLLGLLGCLGPHDHVLGLGLISGRTCQPTSTLASCSPELPELPEPRQMLPVDASWCQWICQRSCQLGMPAGWRMDRDVIWIKSWSTDSTLDVDDVDPHHSIRWRRCSLGLAGLMSMVPSGFHLIIGSSDLERSSNESNESTIIIIQYDQYDQYIQLSIRSIDQLLIR